MKSLRPTSLWLPIPFALLLGLAPAQTPEGADKPAPKPVEVGPAPVRITPPAAEDDPHAEMERLFGEVEQKLLKVNRLLEDAAAGGKRGAAAGQGMKEAVESIDKLLASSRESSQAAIAGIDKILELAAGHEHSAGGT